jgi:tocopherol O-methyltransferase
MIAFPSITKSAIRNHYDLATPFYRLLWGEHIHHGLWEGEDDSVATAQQRLIERLVEMAQIEPGQRILDVGCGMGGSSMALARRHGCVVTGLTLSRLQQLWATTIAAFRGVGRRTRFLQADAEKIRFPEASFDVVWNVECSEHLFDKPAFFRRVAAWLRPGGRVALCAWLAGNGPNHEHQVELVCQHFLCPSLGTAEDYLDWFDAAGLVKGRWVDVTAQVEGTWDICMDRLRTSGLRHLGWVIGANMQRFLDHFSTLRDAYRTRAMRYGVFTAEKPAC